MKRMITGTVLILTALISFAQSSKEPFMVKSLSGANVKEVEAVTSGGNISVAGVSSEPKLEVYIQSNNGRSDLLTKNEIQQRLDEYYNLKVSVDGGKLTATAKPKSNSMNWKKGLSISFRIYVSPNTSTDLTTSGGNISLDNLSGTEDFTTSGGNLELTKVTGHITGRTSGGNITVSEAKDNVDLTTSGGNIDAKNCQGKIRIETSGGSLKLRDLNGDIRATTSGGDVKGATITGDLEAHTSGGNVDLSNLSCSLETSTSGGNIDVEMATLDKSVKITNSGGNIDLQIPKGKGANLKLSGDKIKIEELTNFSGKQDDHDLSGTINGGGIPVTVRAGSGRVHVTFK